MAAKLHRTNAGYSGALDIGSPGPDHPNMHPDGRVTDLQEYEFPRERVGRELKKVEASAELGRR